MCANLLQYEIMSILMYDMCESLSWFCLKYSVSELWMKRMVDDEMMMRRDENLKRFGLREYWAIGT